MLEAVLPLLETDIPRAALLQKSLENVGGDLGTCWVVAPDRQAGRIAEAFGTGSAWSVIAESEILPLPRPRLAPSVLRVRDRRKGWYFQQLLKLAAVARSTAKFCVTLDADVIALRPVTNSAVAPDGRAWSQIETPPQSHPEWYDGASAVLGLPRSPHHHAVTPAVLSPEVCRDLIATLRSRKGVMDRDWADMLLRRTPWSEYSLYNTFLEAVGRFDEYHVRTERPRLYADAVWFSEDFDGWTAGGADAALFTLVQSTSGVPLEDIRARLGRPGG